LVSRLVGRLVGQSIGWLVGQLAATAAALPHFLLHCCRADTTLPPSWLPPPPSWPLPPRCSWDNFFVCVFSVLDGRTKFSFFIQGCTNFQMPYFHLTKKMVVNTTLLTTWARTTT
jgi:hypothetical protein